MNFDIHRLRSAVGTDTVESASRIVFGMAALAVVLALASLLPGLDLLIPRTSVTLAAVVGALATLAAVALLLYLARALAALTRLALDGPAELVEHLASVAHWTVVLVAVLVAHAGLAPAVAPLIEGARWAYDSAFLLAALGPLAAVAARLAVAVDPLAELVADGVAGTANDSEAEPRGADEDTAGPNPDGDRSAN
ncbi:hypothetical protein I7X12_08245 [Halosimplex litoreum]|uniref:Uncharacterized protein n=1 Tax=Halosimplex litoreum TaxID=1198301 RepID=A0A7U3WAE4_9EURY|nr:hypothetical protein [Halosimplex litoreum]QPV64589.1 hypothetical protein I7X12_08245 [Halosimplex litoreum]